MRKKFLSAAVAVAATAMSAGVAHADWWIDNTTVGADGVTVQAAPDHVTFTATPPTFTVNEGEDVASAIMAHTDTGRNNYAMLITLSGDCGAGATVSPDSINLDFSGATPVDGVRTIDLSTITISGLSYTGTGVCSVDFGTSVNGKPYQETGVVVITVNAPATTTAAPDTTVPATDAPTTTAAESAAVPEAGSNSGSLAVMAFGFVLLGWATVAATRRRHSA